MLRLKLLVHIVGCRWFMQVPLIIARAMRNVFANSIGDFTQVDKVVRDVD